MKKFIFLWLLLSAVTAKLNAQGVGINPQGNPPHPSAALDLDFADKGLLIPRVQLTDLANAAPVVNPAKGLLVYNVNQALASGEGFYYWNGLEWLAVSVNAMAWTVQGNQIFYTGGNVGIGTSNPQGILDVQSTTSGLIFPRLTTAQREAISSPIPGMMIYNTTTGCFESYTGSTGGWKVTVCNCNPSGGLISSSANPVCPGDSAVLTVQNYSGNIEWQYSNDSLNFFSMGAFTPSVTVGLAPNQSRYYRVKASYQTCDDAFSAVFKQSAANTLNTQFSPTPAISVAGVPVSFVPQDMGAAAYFWRFQSGTPAQTSLQSPDVTWAAVGNYSVSLSITDANGCTDSSQQTFTISPIPTASMELWLRADSGVVSNNGAVSLWTDWSGHNRHAVQNTLSQQPQVVSNVVNGRPVIHFNGSNEMIIPSFNVGNQSTMFYVINLPSGTIPGQMGVLSDQANFSNRFHFYLRDQSGAQYAVANGGSGFRGGSVSAGVQLVSYVHTGSNHSIFKNGVQILTGSNSTTYTSNNPILLGTAPGVGSPVRYTGDLLEVIIYNRQLNASEITIVETYLRNKYAFP